MAWHTRVGDSWRSSDDLTISELAAIEAVSDVGWAYINPWTNTKTARALLAAWHVRDGASDVEAKAIIDAHTAKTLKLVFAFREDDDLPDNWEDGLPVIDPKAQEVGSTD